MKHSDTSELIIGLVSGVGCNNKATVQALKEAFKAVCYEECHIVEHKVSDFFQPQHFEKIAPEIVNIKEKIQSVRSRINGHSFVDTYIEMQLGSLGRALKEGYTDIWARLLIKNILEEENIPEESKNKRYKVVHIINSLKRKEEIDLLENVYGRNFVVLSIFQHEEERIKFLRAEKNMEIISENDLQEINSANSDLKIIINSTSEIVDSALDKTKYDAAESLVEKDKKETANLFKDTGQQLEKCFSHGHFFIKSSYPPEPENLHNQVRRFVQLIFGHPFREPTNTEFYMYYAQGASLCSLDLDRQVGAVIINEENELVSIGYNDVCKYGGGHFEIYDKPDLRDYKKRYDYNHKKLDELTTDMLTNLSQEETKTAHIFDIVREKLSLITEYKRATHAEMSAILNAARRGVSVRNCTLYVNTYPCHNCTKHLIGAGIIKVIFLHPYPKSESKRMFPEMITDKNMEKEKVFFEHFTGVAPARFSYIFQHSANERQTLENSKLTGKVKDFAPTKESKPRYLEHRNAYVYRSREQKVIENITASNSLI